MSHRVKLMSLAVGGALVASLLTACTEDNLTILEGYKGTVQRATATTQYGGGTEMVILGNDGTVVVIGVDFRDNPPVRVVSDPAAAETTIACDALAYEGNQMRFKETKNCVITTSAPDRFFAL